MVAEGATRFKLADNTFNFSIEIPLQYRHSQTGGDTQCRSKSLAFYSWFA